MPFPRSVSVAIEVVECAPVPEYPTPNLETLARTRYGNRVGSVGLKLDRIRTGFFGGLHYPNRLIEPLTMIRRHLCDHINRTACTQLTNAVNAGDLHFAATRFHTQVLPWPMSPIAGRCNANRSEERRVGKECRS